MTDFWDRQSVSKLIDDCAINENAIDFLIDNMWLSEVDPKVKKAQKELLYDYGACQAAIDEIKSSRTILFAGVQQEARKLDEDVIKNVDTFNMILDDIKSFCKIHHSESEYCKDLIDNLKMEKKHYCPMIIDNRDYMLEKLHKEETEYGEMYYSQDVFRSKQLDALFEDNIIEANKCELIYPKLREGLWTD